MQHHRALFDAASENGALALQLCYYRGLGEFNASPWLTKPEELKAHMESVHCVGGATQIERLLKHYLSVGTPTTPVRGMVFIGDAIEENSGLLIDLAGQCRLKRQPLFLFQEGGDPEVARVFAEMARLSGGAHLQLNAQSANKLRELLGAVVRYARGGLKALRQSATESDKLLLSQLPDKD